MIHFTVFAAALSGFVLLLLAMARHQQDWLRRKLAPPRSRALRWTGFALLGTALAIAGQGLGWAYGAVAWCGWLSMAAVCVVTANIHRERITKLWRR